MAKAGRLMDLSPRQMARAQGSGDQEVFESLRPTPRSEPGQPVRFDEMTRNASALFRALAAMEVDREILGRAADLKNNLASLLADERGPTDHQPFRDYLVDKFQSALNTFGITSGVVAEIGGANNSFLDQFPEFDARYLSLFPTDDPRFIVADISNCPQIPDESFDAVISTSVLEHVTHIQDAGKEIKRILKPGGITVHAVPFSYFFHGAPVDYWRLTTTAMEALFEGLDTVECYFYSDNRRRNNLGSPHNPIDRDGGPAFAPDAFGGWRENWFTIYIGHKHPTAAPRFEERRLKQALMNIMKGLQENGLSEDLLPREVLKLIRHVTYNAYGAVVVSPVPASMNLFDLDEAQLAHMWATRSFKTVRPTPARFSLMALLQAAELLEPPPVAS